MTAASSSVGLAAIQVVRGLGAVPVATTRTRAKREALLKAGAAEVIVTQEEDLVGRVRELTAGRGAEVRLRRRRRAGRGGPGPGRRPRQHAVPVRRVER
ncbi:zinc-binding dehydrogenase [Streptomyces sp. S.PB5]|uniref:zinc-binding dehydrogenase n=1 Tax=Streptomyces sp. S.PB5 TaxID=3020844 RepID=UPI0025B1A8D6|nr:zinc-binding dehydrogenase [Streptomyces sp. S.PB5]MDN3027331.1 zinc-binding dehydrogenase [Streptomyces sp. S.PB5]